MVKPLYVLASGSIRRVDSLITVVYYMYMCICKFRLLVLWTILDLNLQCPFARRDLDLRSHVVVESVTSMAQSHATIWSRLLTPCPISAR
jgi:hypothetical protein